jgi:hypothetical protein
MITLIISAAFKGTKAQFAKALITCLVIDILIALFAIN